MAATASSSVVEATLPCQKEFGGKPFPQVLTPADGAAGDILAWLAANREQVLASARDTGAVLLRGFAVDTPQVFADIMGSALGLPVYPYVGGAAVRTSIVGDRVFTSNESPPSEPIPFHHEVAQSPSPPDYIAFYCEVAPAEGGETPILPSTEVYQYFAGAFPAFASRVESLGVKYIRVMPAEDDASSAIGRSWKSTFGVTDKAGAEAAMKGLGMTWEWLGEDLRTVTGTLPGVRTDSRTGKKSFFNSIVAAYTGWTDSRNDPTKAVVLGDGSPVDGEAMAGVAAWMEANKVAVPWAVGDVLILDNHTAMHSRNPFVGPRRILASLAKRPSPIAAAASAAGAGSTPAAAPADLPRTVKLAGTGDEMPIMGLGMWKVPKDKVEEITLGALEGGWAHLDCAADYGNEAEVGAALAKAFAGGVKREDVWLTSKLWNTFHDPEHVEEGCRKTLSDLGVEYLDLYLIHFPISLKYVPIDTRYPPEWFHDPSAPEPRMEFAPVPLHKTWEAMEALVAKGLVRNIGVCNMNTATLTDLTYYAKVPCSVLQVELHPYNTQDRLVSYAKSKGMAVTGFSPLGAGSYVELGGATAQDSGLVDPVVVSIAAAVGRSPAQVLLRWGVQRGTAIIPKTSKVHRLAENLALFDFTLSPQQMDALSALNANRRFNDPGVFCRFAFNTDSPIYE